MLSPYWGQALEALRNRTAEQRAMLEWTRGMIALRFGAGLGLADVGAAYGISAAAATMAIRRALDTLRSLLKETK